LVIYLEGSTIKTYPFAQVHLYELKLEL
jgi:hypothetical protein